MGGILALVDNEHRISFIFNNCYTAKNKVKFSVMQRTSKSLFCSLFYTSPEIMFYMLNYFKILPAVFV